MTILPREQVTQRHPRSAVSAPGVLLWESQTDLAACDVDVVDEVTYGENDILDEVNQHQEWYVQGGYYGFGFGALGDEPFGGVILDDEAPGVYEDAGFGEGGFGDGGYGGVELDYAEGWGPLHWSFNGVEP